MDDSGGLSPRQLECLRGIAGLLTPEQIATQLGISVPTVNKHLAAARASLGAASTRDAVLKLQQRTGQSLTGQTLTVGAIAYTIDGMDWSEAVREVHAPPTFTGETQAIPAVHAEGKKLYAVTHPLWTVVLIAGLSAALVILLLAIEPLTRSASNLANTIETRKP